MSSMPCKSDAYSQLLTSCYNAFGTRTYYAYNKPCTVYTSKVRNSILENSHWTP